jgi:IS30 family transposase
MLFDDCRDRQDRNTRIRRAHVDHGYTMTKIADHLKLHLMTISRAVRENVEM